MKIFSRIEKAQCSIFSIHKEIWKQKLCRILSQELNNPSFRPPQQPLGAAKVLVIVKVDFFHHFANYTQWNKLKSF